MNSYAALSPNYQELICLWALMLCAGFLVNTVIAIYQRRLIYILVSAASVLPPYLILDMHMELFLHPSDPFPPAAWFDKLNVSVIVVVMLIFSVVFVNRFLRSVRYGMTHITPSSIKEAADRISTGLCYYHDNGQPFLTNRMMNGISFEICGHALLDGNEFYDAVRSKDVLHLKDGSIYRVTRKDFTVDKEPFHELSAANVTELYRKTEQLKERNEKLKLQNARMRDYGKAIDDIVRREEVLKTKTGVHNEMNRLLLATDKAILTGTPEERAQMLDIWQTNILLLCMEANGESTNNALSDLNEIARLIGIELVYDGVPETRNAAALSLFTMAAEEAMTNAKKHAGASTLTVSVTETASTLTAAFENDGALPSKAAKEGGGLVNLRSRIENAGGSMTVSFLPRFRLTVTVPMGGKGNVL